MKCGRMGNAHSRGATGSDYDTHSLSVAPVGDDKMWENGDSHSRGATGSDYDEYSLSVALATLRFGENGVGDGALDVPPQATHKPSVALVGDGASTSRSSATHPPVAALVGVARAS